MQLSTDLITRSEARFQAATQLHQFIDLDDDAVMFGEGRGGQGSYLGFLEETRYHSLYRANERSG